MKNMDSKTATISKEAELTAKVAAMTPEQRCARLEELAHAESSADRDLEFIKLALGPDAEFLSE